MSRPSAYKRWCTSVRPGVPLRNFSLWSGSPPQLWSIPNRLNRINTTSAAYATAVIAHVSEVTIQSNLTPLLWLKADISSNLIKNAESDDNPMEVQFPYYSLIVSGTRVSVALGENRCIVAMQILKFTHSSTGAPQEPIFKCCASWVRFSAGGARLDIELHYHRDMHSQTKAPVVAERRIEVRYGTGDRTAHILMTEPEIACEGLVMDVSRSGMRLRTDRHLEVLRMVTLRIGNVAVAGQVCRCTLNQDGTFDTGILICDIDLA
jgi:hypothetical protein